MEMFVLFVVFVWRSLTRVLARVLDPWIPDDIASAVKKSEAPTRARGWPRRLDSI